MYDTFLNFGQTSCRYHYLCHYLPIASGMDTLSRSLMKFKRGAHPDLEAWIDYAREALAGEPPPRETIILRALGHRETTSHRNLPSSSENAIAQKTRPSSLDLLCQTLSQDFECQYLPTLLSKTRETLPNKGLTRHEREAELLDVYSADLGNISPSNPFLLIDDIMTTGATLRAIIGALRRQSPACPIRVFTLTRASFDSFPRQITPLQGRNYNFDPHSGWIRPPDPSAAR